MSNAVRRLCESATAAERKPAVKRRIAVLLDEELDDDGKVFELSGSPQPTLRRGKLRRIGRWWDATSAQHVRWRDEVTEWMRKLAEFLQLLVDTLDAAISYYDRVVNARDSVVLVDLQCIAATCLLIAAKREEVPEKVPFVSDLCAATDHTITPDTLRQEEVRLLYELKWVLMVPPLPAVLDQFAEILSGRLHAIAPVSLPPDPGTEDSPPPREPVFARAIAILEDLQRVTPFQKQGPVVACRLRSLTWRAARAYYQVIVLEDQGAWEDRHVDAFGYTEAVLNLDD